MKQLLLVITIFSYPTLFSQAIHHGWKLEIDGTLNFIEWIDLSGSYHKDPTDSIRIYNSTFEGWANRLDIENQDLILVHPNERESDAPMHYDHTVGINIIDWTLDISNIIFTTDTIKTKKPIKKKKVFKPHFNNEYDFEGNLDTTYILNQLNNFYAANHGVNLEWSKHYELEASLDLVDSIVEQEEYLKLRVTRATIYEYESTNLTRVIGFDHHEGSVTVDSMYYDKKDNLIYLHRETAGLHGEKHYFKYNRKNRLIEHRQDYYDYQSSYYEKCPNCKRTYSSERHLYSYDKKGYLYSFATEYKDYGVKSFIDCSIYRQNNDAK